MKTNLGLLILIVGGIYLLGRAQEAKATPAAPTPTTPVITLMPTYYTPGGGGAPSNQGQSQPILTPTLAQDLANLNAMYASGGMISSNEQAAYRSVAAATEKIIPSSQQLSWSAAGGFTVIPSSVVYAE